MKLIEIDNIRHFTARLFTGNTFDSFLTVEASFSVASTFTIDGHVNAGFVGEEEMQDPAYREGIIPWEKLRPICFEIIKGKKVPQQFKIVFKVPEVLEKQFLQDTALTAFQDQISGLFLNLSFKNGQLSCTTGSSLKTFSLDRSLEIQWDEYVARFLNKI